MTKKTLAIACALAGVLSSSAAEAGGLFLPMRGARALGRGGAYAALWARQQESSQGPEPVPEVLAPT